MYKKSRQIIQIGLSAGLFVLLAGCNSTEKITNDYRSQISTPQSWKTDNPYNSVNSTWLKELNTLPVSEFVSKALSNNRQLKQQAFDIEIAKQQLTVAGSALWPSLDLAIRNSRRYSEATGSYSNSNSLDLSASYEVDLWGKLSAQERSQNLRVLALNSNYQEQKNLLVANVITTWLSVIEANSQIKLLNDRLKLVTENLEIIESGYRQGLYQALDVYLTRNELNNEKSRLFSEQANQAEQIRKLELLIGEYPAGELVVNSKLPKLASSIPLGLPSELLSRKPSLVASWYALLEKDAALAYAHKQRFPSIKLTGSIGPNSNELSELLKGGNLAWSLASAITAPIFNAGRLKANEQKALLELQKQEVTYLDALFNAFQEVEKGITENSVLKQRFEATARSAENAKLAETLSFEQYLKGLVSYNTVLDAQKRSFDAQSSLISINNLLISNRVRLHLALGGDFADQAVEDKLNDN